MNVIERIEAAVHQPNVHAAVRDLILTLSAEGHRRQAIIDGFMEAVAVMRDRGTVSEQQYDNVADALDGLYGWCHQDHWLLADEFPEALRPSTPPAPGA